MDGFFVAKLKKFAPGERQLSSIEAGIRDEDELEARMEKEGGGASAMEVDEKWVKYSIGYQPSKRNFIPCIYSQQIFLARWKVSSTVVSLRLFVWGIYQYISNI